jgi:type IV pilus assembly protein PilY1
MRKTFASILALFLVLGGHVPRLRADDSDIFGANVKPNVMLAITSSTDLNESISSAAYSASITYDVAASVDPQGCLATTCATTTVYKYVNSTPSCKPKLKPCYILYANSISAVTDSGARSSLSTAGYWNGSIGGTALTLFTGNYLNYLLCTTCGTSQSKVSIMKSVLSNLVANTTGIRFGAMGYSAGGGKMIDDIKDMTSTNQTQLINDINNLDLQGSGHPIGDQMKSAGDYYEGHLAGHDSPMQYSCQPNFLIVLTDGANDGSTDPRLEATALYTQDHNSTFAGMQNIIVHVVTFETPSNPFSADTINILKDTAKNGGGNFYEAFTAAQLEKALNATISAVLNATFSFATPVVPSTGTTGSSRAYLASFQSNPSHPFWRGYLKAFNRDSNGLIPVDTNGIPLSTALAWESGQQVSNTVDTARTIYTAISGSRSDFTTTNTSLTATLLNAADSTEKDNIIKFLRGYDTYDEDDDGNTAEQRQWKLGDIFHSTPALVGPPSKFSTDSSYNTFKNTSSVASRTTILLAGSNDGMMHAITESNGNEAWAFIPPDLLDNIKELKDAIGPHDFYVDGSPTAADVKIGSTPAWKTIALFGERRGGRYYHALDITDTSSPSYLWNFNDSRIGETWSDPAIGKVRISGGGEKWVAFVGGGYDTASNNATGKIFYVIDLTTGAKLWQYYNATGSTDDRQYMNFSLAAAPAIVDLDNDGYIDHVYIGDVGGQMWKFDVSAAATISSGLVTNWTGKRIFAAASSQTNPPAAGEYYPTQGIYGMPALAYDASGNLWVFVGTGDRNHPMNTGTNRMYGFKDVASDMTNGTALTESSLANLTTGTGTITGGWYIVLSSTEKVLAAAEVFNSVVLFTTFTPTSTVTCGAAGGTAKLYSVNMTSGDAALNLATGAPLTTGQSAASNSASIGTGIPSKPVIVMTGGGAAFSVTGTTDMQINETPIANLVSKQLVGWREVF